MKSKQVPFKNPFDLIEQEQEQPMSMPTRQQTKYKPTTYNVLNPLPFNPYQITKTDQTVKVQKTAEVKTQVSYPPSGFHQAPKTFTSPFVNDDKSSTYTNETNRSQELPYEMNIPKEYQLDQNGDPPLLDGIEPEKIKERLFLVLKVGQPHSEMVTDPDLSGPIMIAMTLGCLLLLSGKIHFGDIYAMFIFGNGLIYFLLNFMAQTEIISFYSIMSIMGYGMLPMLGLGLIGIFVSLNGGIGIVVALMTAIWSSFSAGNFMDVLIKDTKDRKLLVIYPLFLFYVSFTMIVIF